MAAGFIHNKLEIRFLILYIASRLTEPVNASDLQELSMIDEGVNYFDFSVCLNDLVDTEHLFLHEDGTYSVTSKGIRNSQICESGLPLSVRLRADKELIRFNQELLRRSRIKGKVLPRENGTYTVSLHLSDEVDELMDLNLMVANEEMARSLQERFEKDPEGVYTKILSVLYG